MIQLAGKPFDIETVPEYATGSVQRLVLEQMDKSDHTYRFDSIGELRFTLSLRKYTVDAAQSLNKSKMRFSTFHESFCNEEFWERTENGGFLLKKGAVPSKAIIDIFENGKLYGTECATAMVIVIYRAVLEAFGEELFDQTFKSIYLMDWSIKQPLLNDISTPKKVADILIGDRAYFMNEQVSPETSWWRGENVIVLPNDLYYGHGIGIQSADAIIKSLNRNRIPDATISAYLMDKAARPNYKRLFSVWQTDQNKRGPLVWQLPQTASVRL